MEAPTTRKLNDVSGYLPTVIIEFTLGSRKIVGHCTLAEYIRGMEETSLVPFHVFKKGHDSVKDKFMQKFIVPKTPKFIQPLAHFLFPEWYMPSVVTLKIEAEDSDGSTLKVEKKLFRSLWKLQGRVIPKYFGKTFIPVMNRRALVISDVGGQPLNSHMNAPVNPGQLMAMLDKAIASFSQLGFAYAFNFTPAGLSSFRVVNNRIMVNNVNVMHVHPNRLVNHRAMDSIGTRDIVGLYLYVQNELHAEEVTLVGDHVTEMDVSDDDKTKTEAVACGCDSPATDEDDFETIFSDDSKTQIGTEGGTEIHVDSDAESVCSDSSFLWMKGSKPKPKSLTI